LIKHIVLFELNEGVAKEDSRVTLAFQELRRLPGRISLIRQWEVGENVSSRPAAADFALYSGFDNASDLAEYVEHPAHGEIVGLLKEVCTWKVCDYVTE
jgi:hypothetical protein